jgi:predicted Zn-dependent protease
MKMNNTYRNIYALMMVGLATIVLYACSVNPVTGKKELMLVSEAQELAMGQQSDPSIIANYGLYDDKVMQAFINEKGKEMGAISHRPDIDYQFRILDSPVINAFAVPGGYVYFTRGIMAHFNNEAEFAGVLGHEIGHITARHSAAQLSKQQLYGGLFVAGMIVSEEFRQMGELAQQGLGLLFLKFGRDDESQSDELGVNYSTKIGYNSHEMANFFGVLNRLSEKSGQSMPTFMSTHPDPADRFNTVHKLSDAYQQNVDKSQLKVNRDSYLKMIDGLVFGDDPRQGYVKYNTFFHPELKFHFPVPPNWQIINTPQMVQMASEDGKALMIMMLSGQQTIQAAVQETIEQDGLQVIESGETTVNGLPAYAMISTIKQDEQQQQGQAQQPTLRILTYLIQYNGLIYKFHGLANSTDFNTYYKTFTNTMTNFDKLTDPQMINVSPDRIKIREVTKMNSLEFTLKGFGVAQDDLENVAILNNMLLTDVIQPGTLIKTIVNGIGNFKG